MGSILGLTTETRAAIIHRHFGNVVLELLVLGSLGTQQSIQDDKSNLIPCNIAKAQPSRKTIAFTLSLQERIIVRPFLFHHGPYTSSATITVSILGSWFVNPSRWLLTQGSKQNQILISSHQYFVRFQKAFYCSCNCRGGYSSHVLFWLPSWWFWRQRPYLYQHSKRYSNVDRQEYIWDWWLNNCSDASTTGQGYWKATGLIPRDAISIFRSKQKRTSLSDYCNCSVTALLTSFP